MKRPPAPAPSVSFGLIGWLESTRIALPLKGVECRFEVTGNLAQVGDWECAAVVEVSGEEFWVGCEGVCSGGGVVAGDSGGGGEAGLECSGLIEWNCGGWPMGGMGMASAVSRLERVAHIRGCNSFRVGALFEVTQGRRSFLAPTSRPGPGLRYPFTAASLG
jgi:hypothetical protein